MDKNIPPRIVWETDQVITPKDLTRWYESMQMLEEEAVYAGDVRLAEIYHINHILCSVFMGWIDQKKPKKFVVNINEDYKFKGRENGSH